MDTTLATFEQDVIKASMLAHVLVDFWAPWCGPCKSLGPMLEKLEAEADGKWKLVKVNVDESPALQQRFGVQAIPTLMVLRNGQVAARKTGAAPAPALRTWLAETLAS